MTIIFSEEVDLSTNHVMNWFIYKNRRVKRYNGKTSFTGHNSFEFNNRKFSIHLDKESESQINFSNEEDEENITSLWFRRPYNAVDDITVDIEGEEFLFPDLEILRSIGFNYKIFKDFFVTKFCNRCLGSYFVTGLNKPFTLELAKKTGLLIPNTIITNSKNDVVEFFLVNNQSIIRKALHEAFRYIPENDNFWISNKTVLIDKIEKIPDAFGPSIFQEHIKKMYEIRCFYLDGEFYSSCIFSQKNSKTQIDFRNYDSTKPNRIVPYKLLKDIENKLTELMVMLKLNTGSIDIIRAQNGEYIFLEVNPVGQYGFISEKCNFNLDYKIFKYLSDEK
ncbi:grasp-with-spasm system ATP-grasp peptide maturase [Aquimarina spongiae]|uniref:ATP-GRASP peptide maturase, grasp-with-spasm system n=1 Tax=Aquimarina spongiae TaxID=570521 RepID=A0A1M6DDF8_9FLAO|nr:grasp-with-spasm system ATP-grasp peptide maturase [Aquimarina spongiae]SHI71242.1 ATP-GRASP peptide maturase, grasp-with-spasm system [Aquimarina spongiae]